VSRAFSYFSHLANIAEDQHHLRRSRAHARAGSEPREGSLPLAIARAQAAHIDSEELARFFAQADIRPVLTAHPTEVQRKSILDCHWQIARLLDVRDRSQLTPGRIAGRRRSHPPRRADPVADAHAASNQTVGDG